MNGCPYCGSELNRPAHRRTSRTDPTPGGKSHGDEFVACPDCGGIIDGFASH